MIRSAARSTCSLVKLTHGRRVVDEFLGQLSFRPKTGCSAMVGSGIFGGQDDGWGGEAYRGRSAVKNCWMLPGRSWNGVAPELDLQAGGPGPPQSPSGGMV